jgi:hypothetical protein
MTVSLGEPWGSGKTIDRNFRGCVTSLTGMPIRISAILALALALGLPATADARAASHLWSTVNVCDTVKSPDTIGIRARMPGDGTRRRMWMRFRTQFYSQDDYAWQYVSTGGRSPWVEVGSAIFAFKETGYEFTFDAPAAGSTFLLRGVVEFQWRSKGGKVVRRTRKFTETGHRTRGADPKDFSAARCRIEGPAPAATPKYVEP